MASRRRRAALVLTGLVACGRPPSPPPLPEATPCFRDAAAETGLAFSHWNGLTGRRVLAEIMGSGLALADLDGDSDLDVVLLQGAGLDPAAVPPPGGTPLGDRLYRNELVPEGALRFTDVTATAGLLPAGYSMGIATGDVDGDGDVDLFVTRFGRDRLFRNRGDGSFEDGTAAAGLEAPPGWSTSATFADLDRDSDLDLFVTRYVESDPVKEPRCYALTGALDYCGPLSYPPTADRFYRNRGDGTFEDASVPSGVAARRGAGLGVVALDADGAGGLDVFVANDGGANFLWIAEDAGGFRDEALERGLALSSEGMARAGMGVAPGDGDGDGDEDLVVTHLASEANALWSAEPGGLFEDRAAASGMGAPSLPWTGFGVGWLDVDLDGRLDLAAVNGGVRVLPEQEAAGDPLPIRMPGLLLGNRGGGRFEPLVEPELARPVVGRGLATGDLDSDGAPDLVLNDNGGPARLLRHRGPGGRHWLGLRVVEGTPARDAIGALVRVERKTGAPLVARVRTDGSYLSARDPRLLFGLGDAATPVAVVVRWPADGTTERFAAQIDRYQTLARGAGEATPP